MAKSQLRVGDTVRYFGRVSDDIYHGECVGRTGVVTQLYPWVGMTFDGETGMHAVGAKYVEKI